MKVENKKWGKLTYIKITIYKKMYIILKKALKGGKNVKKHRQYTNDKNKIQK